MLVRLLLILSCLLTFCAQVAAQEDLPSPGESKPVDAPQDRLTLEMAQKQLETFQKLEGQEALKQKAVPILSQIVKFLQDEQTLKTETAQFRIVPEEIADQIELARQSLATRTEDQAATIGKMRDPEAIRQELTKIQQELSDFQSKLDQLTLRIETREKRRTVIPAEKAGIEKRLEELKQPLAKPEENDPPELLPLRQMLVRAEQQMLLQQREKLSLEPGYYDANSELRTLQRQNLQQAVAARQRTIELVQKRLDQVVQEEARKSADQAQQAILDVPEELMTLADEVAATAQERTSSEGPLYKSKLLKEQLVVTEMLLQKWEKKRDATRKHITQALNLGTVKIGPTIDDERVDLQEVYGREQKVFTYTREVATAREEIVKYNAEIDELANLEDAVSDELELLKLDDAGWLEDDVRALLLKQKEFLTNLVRDWEEYRGLSDQLAQKETELATLVTEYQNYLNSVSMWVQVSEVYSFSELRHAVASIPICFQRSDWIALGRALQNEMLNRPLNFIVFTIALIAFLILHSRLKTQLNSASLEVSQGYLANFAYTWEAFLLSMVLSCWIPLLIGVVGYRLISVAETTAPIFVLGVGYSLLACALLIGILRVIQYLVRGNGLGPVHFRWQKERTTSVRQNMHWYTLSVVPLAFFSTLVQTIGDPKVHDSLGRLLLMAGLLLAALFLYKILAPLRPADERTPPPTLTLWQKFATYGPAMIPLILALMAFAGYTYTAEVLTKRLMISVAVLLVLTIIHEITSRWLYIARGRLALEQARKRQEAREAEEAARAEGKGETSETPKAFDPKSAGIDLSQVNAQTRQLLTTTYRLMIFASLWWIWSGVMPRFGILDLHLWQTDQIVEQALKVGLPGTGEASTEELTTRGHRWVTIGDLVLFVLVLVVTSIASKNLPGLLEITVLQNLPLDTGIRYAAGMLARYFLIGIGLIIAIGMLGIGFGQVSLLLGGLAVGLGFGLQELFANFVSGIILLFEQPLRIGDIVTVGEVSGTVSRIRIRATTITDWDRKEYIVPNKQFITGQFMNWTLSDSTNRIVIPVGVAYGSDTERARQLLLRVCERHPLVLDEPAPSAAFDAFGASALNITMRCFIPNLDNRLAVIHDLHTAIDREFKRAGIEMAFPQLDLHLRTIDRGLSPIPVQQSNGVPAGGEKK